jgi:hypothetical protein
MNGAMSFLSIVPPASQPSPGCTHRYTAQEWEERRPLVKKLYIEKEIILKDVIASLSETGFVVT